MQTGFKELFGANAVAFAATKIIDDENDMDHIKGVLTSGGKHEKN